MDHWSLMRAEFSWRPEDDLTETSSTDGTLRIEVDSGAAWPSGSGLQWTWVELLEWLSMHWIEMNYEHGLPSDWDEKDLRDFVYRYDRPIEDAAIWTFLEAHDLSKALEGALASPLVVWRDGNLGHIVSAGIELVLDWPSVRKSLESIGNEIARRAEDFPSDERGAAAVEGWARRNAGSPVKILGISIQANMHTAERLLSLNLLPADVLSQGSDAAAEDEMLAVARMTAGLPLDVVEAVLRALRDVGAGDRSQLDQMANRISIAKLGPLATPFEQGYEGALALRSECSIAAEEKFPLIEWLQDHGVVIKELDFGTNILDAMAAWGRRRGPVIIINSRGKRSQTPSGRNSSLAHEIGHFLFDMSGALPAAEVLGGRIDKSVEQRANAFAAELLLPRAVAGGVMAAADADNARASIASLTSRFHVSREIVAWQARNSGIRIGSEVMTQLRLLVSSPHRF